ncbi:MAG: DUF5714 domain-containing protein [Promethearchaeota archaeon]
MVKSSSFDTACMVCGESLVYCDKGSEHICDYCGLEFTSTIYCPKGHFICDECHSGDAIELFQRMAESNESKSPIEVVEFAFAHHAVKLHGPEHHSLVPAALLIAMKNRDVIRPNGEKITAEMIKEGIRRGSKIPGGFCGSAGNCGACVGAGIAVAVYLGSTPKKGPERKSSHLATIAALKLVTDGLVRCCKRSTLYGITAATRILREDYGVDLGPEPASGSCQNSHLNRDCVKDECTFYPTQQQA